MRFAAIDFETASGARVSACSLGIAVVEDGAIVARREWLIRPPSLYFSPLQHSVHGITPEMVADAPEFDAAVAGDGARHRRADAGGAQRRL